MINFVCHTLYPGGYTPNMAQEEKLKTCVCKCIRKALN